MERSADTVLRVISESIVRAKGDLSTPLTLDTPLLEGLVDSFGLIELSEDIARALDLPLLSGNFVPEDFETPRTVWNRIQEILS